MSVVRLGEALVVSSVGSLTTDNQQPTTVLYRTLHSATHRPTRVRTIISVAGVPGQRIYQRERYQLPPTSELLTDECPCTERTWSIDGEQWDIPTEEAAMQAVFGEGTPQNQPAA